MNFIDVLTVLVFFLLVNSTGVAILGVNLPGTDATASKLPPHQLTVSIHPAALTVADENGTIRKFNQLPDGRYNLAGLGKLLEKIKARHPDETKITLLLEPGIPYNALVEVMDTVREQPTADDRELIQLFPDIELGDAPPESSAPASTASSAGAQP